MSKYKSHSFDIQIACEYGMTAAVIVESLYYWIDKNRNDGKHFHDGLYWTYSSVSAMMLQYPYLTRDKIKLAIKKLVEAGLIIEGNYNQSQYDRTKWYALTNLGLSYYEDIELETDKNPQSTGEKSSMEERKTLNDNINNSNNNKYTVTKTITNDHHDDSHPSDDEFFESLWLLYPKKKGKASVSKAQKKKLQKVGYDVLAKCIDNYKKYISDHDVAEQYVMYGSSFFNKGYIDYLPDDEEPIIPTKPKVGGRE